MSHYSYRLQLLINGEICDVTQRAMVLLDAIDPDHPLDFVGFANHWCENWEYEAPLSRLSREPGGIILSLTVYDHDTEDQWRDYFKNGYMQTTYPSLTFAKPDDNNWLVVKENSGGEEEDEAIEV